MIFEKMKRMNNDMTTFSGISEIPTIFFRVIFISVDAAINHWGLFIIPCYNNSRSHEITKINSEKKY